MRNIINIVTKLSMGISDKLFYVLLMSNNGNKSKKNKYSNARLSERNQLDLVVVAFNNHETVRIQYEELKNHLKDKYSLLIADNSNKPEISENIYKFCTSNGISYVKIPTNFYSGNSRFLSRNGSKSHGSAINWVLRYYLTNRNSSYIGFLDHDIFPRKDIELIPILKKQPVYGHLQPRDNLWYLWPGFCFFNTDLVHFDCFDFMPGKIGTVRLDTGGMNWNKIFSKIDKSQLKFPSHKYELVNPEEETIQKSHVEQIGDWVHSFNASGWL